ncbi:MAG: hypothetical protein ACREIC_13655 [Limisphaerales bacterium]
MLTQLSTVKARLSLTDTDTSNDATLTNAIQAVSVRFDHECNRALARTQDLPFEFSPSDMEIVVDCYPIEVVTRFEVKTSEALGWLEQTDVDFVIRRSCVISLCCAMSVEPASATLCRVIYTGGYVMPGTEPLPGQQPLPADIEQAAADQVAYWFQNRDRLGLQRIWDYHSTYRQFADLDLLTTVRAVLERYTRWMV